MKMKMTMAVQAVEVAWVRFSVSGNRNWVTKECAFGARSFNPYQRIEADAHAHQSIRCLPGFT